MDVLQFIVDNIFNIVFDIVSGVLSGVLAVVAGAYILVLGVGLMVLLFSGIICLLVKIKTLIPSCSDPIKLDLVIRVVIYCPDIFMPRNACAYTV